jgi:hypothetical protein
LDWTLAKRGKILACLYTILLANPRRNQKPEERTAAATRFKLWYELVGSAVEFAAKQHKRIAEDAIHYFVADPLSCSPTPVDFKDLFLTGEAEDDDQSKGLVTVLTVLLEKWPERATFEAREVVDIAQNDSQFRTALEQAAAKAIKDVTATIVAWRLKALRDTPTLIEEKTAQNTQQQIAALRYRPQSADRNTAATFWVETW